MPEVAVKKAKAEEAMPEKHRWFAPMVPFGEGLFGMSPFRAMREFAAEMERMFGNGAEFTEAKGEWWPAVECKQTNGDYLVRAELPGLTEKDVKVEVSGDMITIEGEKKKEEKTEKEGYFRTERHYGKFFRQMALPEGAHPENVTAKITNGVLEVKVPVTPPKVTARQVPVQAK